MLIYMLSSTMAMTLVAPMPRTDQGLGTKFPLIPNLIATDGVCGPSCPPCLHIDIRWERWAEMSKGLLPLTVLGTTSIRRELCHNSPSLHRWQHPSANSPRQQPQRETHRLVSCHHPCAQQLHGEPPHCRGAGRAPPYPHPALSPASHLSLGQHHRPELRPFSGI